LSQPNYVIILGKAMTGQMCPWEDPTVDEVWGVNNVADQPENLGPIKSIGLTNQGEGYTHAELSFEGGGGSGSKITIEAKEGKLCNLKILEPGIGYTTAPKVIITGDGHGAVAECQVIPKRKFTRLFAFDDLSKEYTDAMKKHAPVTSVQAYADIPYPLEDVQKDFGIQDYYTNTVSYMVALAAHMRVKKIGLYGVDVAFGAPYAQEMRGVEYWIGRAAERGVEIIAPPESQLMRTLSGVRYGVKDHCNMMLYLHERINLINILPKRGNYSEALKAQNAYWVLFPKSDEAQEHGVTINRTPDGMFSFTTSKGEFLSDVHMPPEVWEYLRGILRDSEAKGNLDFGVITAYEKLILSKPDGGN
jgi:hypothetical protein